MFFALFSKTREVYWISHTEIERGFHGGHRDMPESKIGRQPRKLQQIKNFRYGWSEIVSPLSHRQIAKFQKIPCLQMAISAPTNFPWYWYHATLNRRTQSLLWTKKINVENSSQKDTAPWWNQSYRISPTISSTDLIDRSQNVNTGLVSESWIHSNFLIHR